jgi:hypothetical protein
MARKAPQLAKLTRPKLACPSANGRASRQADHHLTWSARIVLARFKLAENIRVRRRNLLRGAGYDHHPQADESVEQM